LRGWGSGVDGLRGARNCVRGYVVGTPNAAARTLRRLLSLPPAPAPNGAEPGAGKAWREVELSAMPLPAAQSEGR
jgi:hypothetical protein